MLVGVESVDNFYISTLAIACSVDEFRTIEASLYQLLHRKTANEPLKIEQQTQGEGIRSMTRDRENIRPDVHV